MAQCSVRGFRYENKSSSNIVTGIDSFITKPVKALAEDLEEKKREEHRKRQEKENEAQRKRKEMIDAKREAQKRKREEKQLKVQQAREAMEQEKLEQKLRAEREKEEKARQAAEREEKQKEEIAKRKQQALQKQQETEERRKHEELARLARIKEQEEDHRRAEVQRKKEEADLEKQNMKRLAQEKEAAAADAAIAKQLAMAKKKLPEPPPLNGTFVIPKPGERPPLREENENNYYLADLSEGESSDEEDTSTAIPKWANSTLLRPQYHHQLLIPDSAWSALFSSCANTPDLAAIFNNKKLGTLKRTSSAVWRTPPRYSRMRLD